MLHVRKNGKLVDEAYDACSDRPSAGLDKATTLCHYIRQSFGEVVDDPCARWFSKRPHVLQEHSNIDILFDDVERVDVAFQELVRCWS
jgi:hypothetical protein